MRSANIALAVKVVNPLTESSPPMPIRNAEMNVIAALISSFLKVSFIPPNYTFLASFATKMSTSCFRAETRLISTFRYSPTFVAAHPVK